MMLYLHPDLVRNEERNTFRPVFWSQWSSVTNICVLKAAASASAG